MTAYSVFVQGINRHECIGIFTTLELATEAALVAKTKERDNYHSFVVVPFEINKIHNEMTSYGGRIEPEEIVIFEGDINK